MYMSALSHPRVKFVSVKSPGKFMRRYIYCLIPPREKRPSIEASYLGSPGLAVGWGRGLIIKLRNASKNVSGMRQPIGLEEGWGTLDWLNFFNFWFEKKKTDMGIQWKVVHSNFYMEYPMKLSLISRKHPFDFSNQILFRISIQGLYFGFLFRVFILGDYFSSLSFVFRLLPNQLSSIKSQKNDPKKKHKIKTLKILFRLTLTEYTLSCCSSSAFLRR